LKKRGSLEPRERAVYDYRLLQWLGTMLDSSPEGGIGDINNVLDTLDREAIRKHLKDENVDALLNLVERLLDIMDFWPVGFAEKEVEYQGKKIKTTTQYVEKSIMVASQSGGEITALTSFRTASNIDIERRATLKEHIERLQYFTETGARLPEIRTAEYFKEQIIDAHGQGLIALAYDTNQPTKEEARLYGIDKIPGPDDLVLPEGENITKQARILPSEEHMEKTPK
jgi:hypothetical protein